ncbi:MAG: hypothetical protein ACTSVW_05925, partial [Candidatus Njordarchaeales archaeon]
IVPIGVPSTSRGISLFQTPPDLKTSIGIIRYVVTQAPVMIERRITKILFGRSFRILSNVKKSANNDNRPEITDALNKVSAMALVGAKDAKRERLPMRKLKIATINKESPANVFVNNIRLKDSLKRKYMAINDRIAWTACPIRRIIPTPE